MKLSVTNQADFVGNSHRFRSLYSSTPRYFAGYTHKMSGPTPQQAEDLFKAIEEKFPHSVAGEAWYLVVVGSPSPPLPV